MRCFYVLVHGKLNWLVEPLPFGDNPDVARPTGFFCYRYVLASGESEAKEKAFRRVRQNLERQTGWLGQRLLTLCLTADEVATARMHMMLKPDNRGHTFYDKK